MAGPTYMNRIIRPELNIEIGTNINGPSLIQVPDWVPSPLGRYYLYFAHHQGKHIQMAYSDHLQGPWTVYGVVPKENKVSSGQRTAVALSADGLAFRQLSRVARYTEIPMVGRSPSRRW